MSRKFKSQASSARAASSTLGAPPFGLGGQSSAFQTTASPLSYVTEFPNLNAITEASTIVAFKNLTKKDSVTKAKALGDLQENISSSPDGGPETAVLEAWIDVYPRTSIDNSRRVRQLAHSLQGFFTVSSGKRIAPQLPKVVGAWLTGAFDSDRSVSRAALESFEIAFPSEEKREAVWSLYQRPLLDYVEDAILRHTPQTLSDERSTSPDDAESKYVRVVSTALLLFDQLLQIDPGGKGLSLNETFQIIVNAKTTWELASHKDATVRRAIYKLIVDVVNCGIELDWKMLSSCFLAKSLHISQAGSSAQYNNALLAITKARPSVWTSELVSKTAISRRFYQYLRQGSQRGSEFWWFDLGELIKSIPTNVWSRETTDSHEQLPHDVASQLLSALHEGVINSDEPRQNSVAAWSTYMSVFFWTLDLLCDDDQRHQLSLSFLYPVIERYLLATSDLAQWTVPASTSLQLCSSSVVKLESLYPLNVFGAFYRKQVGNLAETMRLSQPESSKSFKFSQDDLIQKTRRFMDLQTTIEKDMSPTNGVDGAHMEHLRSNMSLTFAQSNIDLLREAVKLLRDRNGKPYGAAGAMYLILDKRPKIIDQLKCSSTPLLLSELLVEDAPRLLESLSAELLVSILLKCRSMTCFEKSFNAVLEQFLRNEALRSSHAYTTFLRGLANGDLSLHADLVEQLLWDIEAALGGDDSRWPIVYEILNNESLSHTQVSSALSTNQSIQSHVLEDMLRGLTLNEKEDNALKGFDFILNRDASTRVLLPSSVNLGTFLTRLLIMSDSEKEEKASKAARLASLVKRMLFKQDEVSTGASAIEIIRRQLDGEGELIPILSLVEIARESLEGDRNDQSPTIASAIFPTAAHWQKALTPFTQLHPPPSISLYTPLQGSVYLVDRVRRRSSGGLPRDSEGFSVALRLTIFVTKLLENMSLGPLANDQLQAIYLYYPQALQVANDKLNIESSNALWIDSTEEIVQEIRDTVADGQKLIHSWVCGGEHENHPESKPTLISCWLSQSSSIRGTSVQAYNLARTFTNVMTEASDHKGASRYMLEWDASLRAVRSSPDILKSAALLAVCRDTLATSALGKRLCNELVADATEINFNDGNDAVRRLVLLNLLIQGEEDLIGDVPSQRLIFLAKHLLSVTSFDQASAGLQSEILSTLASILPPIKDLYGDFWQRAVVLLTHSFGGIRDASEIVPLHSALGLHACLLSLTKSGSNEDLEEEFSKAKSSLETCLLNILKCFDDTPLGANLPLEVTTTRLARQVQDLTFARPEDITDLYALLSSEDRAVQRAAYGILHRSLSSIQEQLSIEVALSKTAAHLPEELLSLLLDAPSMDLTSGTVLSTDSFWIDVQRYLLSWKVVFDHFSRASHVVRETYVADVKDHGHLEYLLSFTCDLLRIVSSKPIDASKFQIASFTLDEEDSSEREAQWLTTHLYYLSLLYLPSLTKSWWIEQKNRIKAPLESWSQKHISPLIISASLTTVSEWLATQDSTEDRALSLKINPRASELVASIPIDPESPPISLCISLPPSYPFANALVTSRTRVGVSEQKWQSWLRTIQGIIMFSNGSLIDGLLAFRRNVQGALKGQTECAICYSVIGTDMKTPDKKCATCKNTFHSACLFRWFRSSNSSSCPLCRNAFHYA